MRLYGAELILTKGIYRTKGAIDTAYRMAAKDSIYYMPDQFSNPANPLAHYETTGAEILADFPEKIDYLVAGIGTGGTLTGVARRLKEKYPDVKVIGVEPSLDDPIQGLRCMEEYIPPVMDLTLVTEKITVASADAAKAIRLLLTKEGVFAGFSSGAAIHQCLRIASELGSGNIVTILPDGGWKYLSLDLWKV
jgi:cysteine synthase